MLNTKRNSLISELTIPCHWDITVLDKIMSKSADSKNVKVTEIYGALAKGAIAHGRNVDSVPDVSREQAINFRLYLKNKYGIDFVYIINVPFTKTELDSSEKEYISWIVNDFRPEAIMVMAPTLIKYIKKKYPAMKIYISTIAGIKNIKDLERYLVFNPRKIVGHHDLNRNFEDLKRINEVCNQNNIKLEIMATESCLRGCLQRDAHYLHLAQKNKDSVFHTDCNSRKIKNPYELLKSNFIRPEDLDFYNQMGIYKFKITGRSKPAEWLPETVNAFLNESYSGNLIRLLGINPSYKFEEWLFIDNGALNGFLENFPQSGEVNAENEYCNKWIINLYNNNAFSVEGIKYEINRQGFLECVEASGRARKLNIIS